MIGVCSHFEIVDLYEKIGLPELWLLWPPRNILFPMSVLPTTVSDSCYARVGLMGNPSDGFKGKTLSFLLENFKATVHITEKPDDSRIELAEPVFFDSLDSLFTHSQKIVSLLMRFVLLLIQSNYKNSIAFRGIQAD